MSQEDPWRTVQDVIAPALAFEHRGFLEDQAMGHDQMIK